MPLPNLSRILGALSARRQTGAEPYRLIEQGYAPANGRRKTIRLSAKGRKFIARVTAILDQQLERWFVARHPDHVFERRDASNSSFYR
jgi:DNA-binding MarR family transcriptional regulator